MCICLCGVWHNLCADKLRPNKPCSHVAIVNSILELYYVKPLQHHHPAEKLRMSRHNSTSHASFTLLRPFSNDAATYAFPVQRCDRDCICRPLYPIVVDRIILLGCLIWTMLRTKSFLCRSFFCFPTACFGKCTTARFPINLTRIKLCSF